MAENFQQKYYRSQLEVENEQRKNTELRSQYEILETNLLKKDKDIKTIKTNAGAKIQKLQNELDTVKENIAQIHATYQILQQNLMNTANQFIYQAQAATNEAQTARNEAQTERDQAQARVQVLEQRVQELENGNVDFHNDFDTYSRKVFRVDRYTINNNVEYQVYNATYPTILTKHIQLTLNIINETREQTGIVLQGSDVCTTIFQRAAGNRSALASFKVHNRQNIEIVENTNGSKFRLRNGFSEEQLIVALRTAHTNSL